MKSVNKKRLLKVIISALILVILLFIYMYIRREFGITVPCVFHMLTGLYCPGCGNTRMIISIVKLDFYGAFRYNPLMFIYLPFIIIYFAYKIYLYIINKEDKIISNIPRKYVLMFIVITVVYGILRNIELFSFLRPTAL